MNSRILIVDDESDVRMMYRAALETEEFEVTEADSATVALEKFVKSKFDAAVLDLRMPEMDGLQLLQGMRDKHVTTPAVIITAYGDVHNAVKAMKLGAIDFLSKPVTPEGLRKVLQEVIQSCTSSRVRPSQWKGLTYKSEPGLHLIAARRAVYARHFDEAREHLLEVIKQNDHVIEAHNLLGVLCEMNNEFSRAKKCYGRAIAIDSSYEPAQQNMRRMFELSHVGVSSEAIHLGDK